MLTEEQIIDKIKNPACGEELQAGVLIQNAHKLHITGDGYKMHLNQLVGFESESDYDIRLQLTDPGTVQLSALILDNLNRWVTNQGTVKTFQFKQEGQGEKFKEVLDQVWRGDSLESFISTFYKEAIYQEMMGFLLVTKPKIVSELRIKIRDGVESKYNGEVLDPYLIFIEASDVKDFNGVGDDLEYLIWKVGETDNGDPIYRVIDDTQDLIIIDEGEKTKIRKTDIMPNEIGYVPAIQVSNILKTLTNDKIKTSPIDHVIPALNRYMQKDSDLIIQMVRHMYPKMIAVTTSCKVCDGKGHYFDKETKITCKSCNGGGKIVPISRDGVLGIPQYLNEGHTPYPGSPASYITPDNASLQIAIDDLKDLGKEILYSATGDKNLIAETLNTATENLINFKGLEDRIAEIVEMVESREEFIIKTVAKMHQDFTGGFKSTSVRYGRRLVIRGENEIMSEIKAAKDAGMPISHIEALQKELIYARYKNNKIELERQQLLADLEPLNGYTVSEVIELTPYVSPDDLKVKFNFNLLIDKYESTKGPVQLISPKLEWKKRVEKIYTELKTLSNEILLIPRESGQD